jgi:hypothetical protein
MMKFSGYYKYDAEPYSDYIGRHEIKGFFCNAYLFKESGLFFRAVKKIELIQNQYLMRMIS